MCILNTHAVSMSASSNLLIVATFFEKFQRKMELFYYSTTLVKEWLVLCSGVAYVSTYVCTPARKIN